MKIQTTSKQRLRRQEVPRTLKVLSYVHFSFLAKNEVMDPFFLGEAAFVFLDPPDAVFFAFAGEDDSFDPVAAGRFLEDGAGDAEVDLAPASDSGFLPLSSALAS